MPQRRVPFVRTDREDIERARRQPGDVPRLRLVERQVVAEGAGDDERRERREARERPRIRSPAEFPAQATAPMRRAASMLARDTSSSSSMGIGDGSPAVSARTNAPMQAPCPLSCFMRLIFEKPGQS